MVSKKDEEQAVVDGERAGWQKERWYGTTYKVSFAWCFTAVHMYNIFLLHDFKEEAQQFWMAKYCCVFVQYVCQNVCIYAVRTIRTIRKKKKKSLSAFFSFFFFAHQKGVWWPPKTRFLRQTSYTQYNTRHEVWSWREVKKKTNECCMFDLILVQYLKKRTTFSLPSKCRLMYR